MYVKMIIMMMFYLVVLHALLPMNNTLHDSSAVYFNKAQFDKNQSNLTCQCRVKVKSGLLWSDFNYEAKGIISIKSPGGKRAELRQDTIYGLYVNGIKYRYLKEYKLYIAVLADGLPVNFYLRDKEDVGFKNFSGNVVYNTAESIELKKFSKENIQSQFSGNAKLLGTLTNILEQSSKYNGGFTHSKFMTLQKMMYKSFQAQ